MVWSMQEYLRVVRVDMNLGILQCLVNETGPGDGEMDEMTLPSRRRIEHWRSEAEYANSRSRRLPTILYLNVSRLLGCN